MFVENREHWHHELVVRDEQHEFDEKGKKDGALTLCSDMVLKNVVQFCRTEDIFDHAPGHDGHGSVFGYAIEQFILKLGTPPWKTTISA
ncbi:MAG: hypothetical protein FWH27_02340 [Planctomycetaceae bacterium]|nr:hypothetical protein [Planctomycetaceae bacterium]